MSNKGLSDNSNERRNYFRLKNSVLIEFRPASKDEVDAFLSNEENIKADKIDVTYQIDQISRQLNSLLQNVRQESNAVAQYLELLNSKVDYLASMLSFEKFRNAALDGILESTQTLDISEGGMSILSKKRIEMNEFVYCKMAIMGYRLGMETFGKVVRVDESKNHKGQFILGVEFPFLKELDRRNLTRYIFDKQREQIHKRDGK